MENHFLRVQERERERWSKRNETRRRISKNRPKGVNWGIKEKMEQEDRMRMG